MSSERENCTPSWKVNLTQKFNKSSDKMQKNQGKFTFDDQLQQRLNFIPIQRQQLSTNKKDKRLKGQQKKEKVNNQGSQQKNDFNRKQQQNPQENFNNQKTRVVNYFEGKIQRLRFSSLEKKKGDLDYYSFFTDPNVAKLFSQYFQPNETIALEQFVEICCQELLSEKQCPSQFREELIEQCRSLFCTTNDNLISLNAVQMLTKKTDLKFIMFEALMNAKFQKRKKNLQQQYEEILQHIIEEQQNIKKEEERIKKEEERIKKEEERIKKEEEKVEKKRMKVQTQEKQVRKKQLQLKAQQKEVIQKEKQIRKILEDKYSRMLEQFTSQCDNHLKEIDKRANGFERNARNKMELLEKRHNNFIKAVLEQSGGQRKPGRQGNSELVGSLHKQNNEVILLRSKLRKVEKELQVLMVTKSKEWEELQKESTSLLKANTLLETKLQKSKEKVKQLSQILAKNNLQLKHTHDQLLHSHSQLSKQSQRVSYLEEQLLKIQHQNTQHIFTQQRISPQQPPNSLRGKTFTFSKQQKPPKGNQLIQEQEENHPLSITILNLNQFIQSLMEGFAAYQPNYHNQIPTSPIIKIEEILLSQAQQILTAFSKILWTAIKHSITNISAMVEFMIKLFLGKFSFLRFQSITNQSGQNYLNELQDFAESISQMQLNKGSHKEIEEKLKIISPFIAQYELNQSFEDRLSLYLVMMMLGIDQTFNFKNNKIQPLIKHTLSLILSLDNKNFPIQSKTKILNTFYDSELLAFLFWKYMSYSTPTHQASFFMDVLIQISNLQNQITDFNTTFPLFKSMHALESYKYLTNFLILNFTEKNLQKNQKQIKQTLEKVSIILQRFCYFSKGKVMIDEQDGKRLKKIMKQIKKNEQLNGSMFKANMKSILQTIFENKQEQTQY